jgi:putative effector of murein hydrolase
MNEHSKEVRSMKYHDVSHKSIKEYKGKVETYVLIGLTIFILVFAVGQMIQVEQVQESVVSESTATPMAVRGSYPLQPQPEVAPSMVGEC